MNTEDLRIKKTKQALKKTLDDLLSKKQLSKISITELTETAEINRTTFYLYYLSIYDLWSDSLMDEYFDIITKEIDSTFDSSQIFETIIQKSWPEYLRIVQAEEKGPEPRKDNSTYYIQTGALKQSIMSSLKHASETNANKDITLSGIHQMMAASTIWNAMECAYHNNIPLGSTPEFISSVVKSIHHGIEKNLWLKWIEQNSTAN